MKAYLQPTIELSSFDVEDIMVASGTTAAVSSDIGSDLVANGYEFVSKVAEGSTPEVKAGAVFSWN